jgi:endonuclease YncB( thermonuclease family)
MTPPRRRLLLRSAVVATVLGLAACRPATAGPGGPATGPGTRAPLGAPTTTAAVETNAVIAHVVDGDTVDVRIDGRRERVRLIGINTPETKDPRRPVECYGPEASALTTLLLPAGTGVRLERDVEARDDYGRLLAYVRRSDGLFVNLELARQGAAVVLSIRPNTAFAAIIAAAADEARRAGRGLWGACPSSR